MSKSEPIRILYMEDDPGLARLTQKRLGRAGYIVDIARDGQEGLTMYVAGSYDVVAVDQNMPVHDGLEVIRILASRGPLPPTIMVTGTGNEQIAVEAMKLGARDYVVKDVDGGYLDLLPTVIEQVLQQQRLVEERRQALEALRESEERLSQIVQGSSVPTFVIDHNHIVTHWNKACENLTGVSANEVIGTQKQWSAFYPAERVTVADLVVDSAPEEEIARYYGGKYQKSTLIEAAYEAEDFFPDLGEGGKWLFFTAAPLRGVGGNVIGAIETLQDITERKRAEETITRLAYHDTLTGLPNRRLFNDRLNMAMAHAQRNRQKLAVMLFDLDHFKEVNDTLGHSVGDRLLQAVSERLTSLLRKGDTVARMGGDEFMLLLPEITQVEGVAEVAQKILEAFREPYVFDDHELHVTTSIGIALYPDAGEDEDTLMKNADIAMYRAKDQGRDNYQSWQQ